MKKLDIVMGLADKVEILVGSRRVRGIADPLALEERLANLISDRIAREGGRWHWVDRFRGRACACPTVGSLRLNPIRADP